MIRLNQIHAGDRTNPCQNKYIQIDAQIAHNKDELANFIATRPALNDLLAETWVYLQNVKNFPCTSVKPK